MKTLHEFERTVLGRMILEPETSDYAFEKLTLDCFYSEDHRIVFQHLRSLWETDSTIDSLALCHRLESNDALEKVGGEMYIVELVDVAAMPSSLPHHVDQLFEAKRCRDLGVLGVEISQRVKDKDTSEEIISVIEAKLSETVGGFYQDSFSTLESLNLDDLSASTTYPTGFLDLDQRIGGLPKGELWVLAGRPSVGKTALALNIAVNLAREGVPVGLLSLEMSLSSLYKRVVSSEVRLPHTDLRNRAFVEKNRKELEEAVKALRQLPLYFDASPEQTTATIKAKAHRLARTRKIQVLFIDYLQLIRGPKSETREREISTISAALKSLAKQLDVSVVALCQLNRRCEDRADKRPVLADLRESGAIEQDADGVLLLNRPELYGIKKFDDGTSTEGVVELSVAKNRNGDTGALKLTFLRKYTRFENYEKEER